MTRYLTYLTPYYHKERVFVNRVLKFFKLGNEVKIYRISSSC